MKSIAVFCGSSPGNDKEIVTMASQLGKTLAQHSITLVYGGTKVGLMEKLANSTLEHKGKVIGVIPSFLKAREVFHENLSELIVVESMHERKMKMNELSEGIIALPGGFGTLEELFEMITWGQMGLHQKPVGLLNVNGFYTKLLHFLDTTVSKGFLKQEDRDMLLTDDSCTGLLGQMISYQPRPVPAWLKKEQT